MAEPDKDLSERIKLRLATPDDDAFLQELYFSTREEDLAMWGMPEEQGKMLVDMQFRAQKMQYDAQFPEAKNEIILLDGHPAGRLLNFRNEAEVFAVDISVLTQYRSQGIGTVVFRSLMREAEESGRPLNFSVVRTNSKAIKLYRRLGIDFVGETDSHYLLRWHPGAAGTSGK